MSLNKSFARRVGRSLSPKNREILAQILPDKEYKTTKLALLHYEKIFLEIGFGMGEHFVHQIKQNPQNLYIGVEVYLNGVASCLKELTAQKHNNYLLWADDLDLVLTNIKGNSLDGIYILFPDPWPKKRYLKKRLFNQERLIMLKAKLKQAGKIFFASDIEDYFMQAKLLLTATDNFSIEAENDDFLIPPPGYIATKYHKKALAAGRVSRFLTAKINH